MLRTVFVLVTLMTVWQSPIAGAQERLMIYPAQDQSAEQLSDDRYECHLWAVEQSHFDPSNPPPEPAAGSVRVAVGANPKQGAAEKGTLAGAVAGGLVGSKRDDTSTAEGAIIGAVIGSIIGGAVEEHGQAAARDQAQQQASAIASSRAEARAKLEQDRRDYQRALAVCLEGRGYVVR